jgi:hypothetical protein
MTSYPVRPQNLSAIRPTMTALSRRNAVELYLFSDLTHMARLWLVLATVMAFGSAGCLITDTPEYKAPRTTPPILTNVKPRTEVAQQIKLQPGTNLLMPVDPISFDITSEDLGQPVIVYVLLNFKGFQSLATPDAICVSTIPAGTLRDDKARPFTCQLELNSRVLPHGCYTLTAVASHGFFPLTATPVKQDDVTVVTWFYQIGVDDTLPDSHPDKYEPCRPDPTPVDAGADARTDRGGA